MGDGLKIVGLIFVGIVLLVGLIFGGIWLSSVTLPWQESIRREVYEESLAFVRGKNQRLLTLCVEYRDAAKTHKTSLRSLFIHESAEMPDDKMTPDVLNCKRQILGQ